MNLSTVKNFLSGGGSELKQGHRFMFEMTGLFLGGFTKVKRIERKIPRKAYVEGGRNDRPIMLTEQQTELQQLVLETGFVKIDPMLKAMRIELLTDVQVFLPGILMVLDNNKMPVRIFVFEQAIVSEWNMSDLEANKSEVITDSIVVHHSGLLEVSLDGLRSII